MLLTKVRVVGILYLIVAAVHNVSSLFKMTNFECESFNKSWVVFQECRLKAIKRDLTVSNMKAELLYPTYVVDLNIEVFKKANGYKPFPMKTTIDACAFMKKRNDPVLGVIYDLFKDFSTLNHTCPYVGHQALTGFYPKHDLLKWPLHSGEYVIWLTWYFHSKKTLCIKVFWSFIENAQYW